MDENLSAQDEIKYYNYYGLPYYWAGDEIWGPVTVPKDMISEGIERKIANSRNRSINPIYEA